MKAQADTDDLVLQLDEEVEGFQANIMSLQAKLEKAKKRIKELEGEIAGQKQDPDKKDENKDDGKSDPMALLIQKFEKTI